MANTFNLGNGNWAQKTEKLLAYNAENDNYKPLPFDFDRASSATRVNKQGLIETVATDEPRIDFLNNSKGHLLLEPSRKNDVTYSNDISTYSNFGSTDDVNVTISPDGSQNASSFEGNGVYDQVLLSSSSMTLASAGSYTISVFAKKGTNNFMQLFANGFTGASNTEAYFDLENGTTPTSGANIEDYGSGWYRCSTTVTIDAGDLVGILSVRVTPSTSDFRWSPISANVGKSVFVYGFQMEAGSYATSYIPTSGSAVTRSAETNYQQNVTQVIGQSEGTMYIEFVPKDTLAPIQILCQIRSSSGTIGQTDIRLQGGNIRALANDGGSNQFNIDGGSYTAGTTYKVAIRYKLNDSKLYINGSSVGSDTSCSFTGSSLDQISFAENLSSLLPVADILDARLYDTGLSDAELIALTT